MPIVPLLGNVLTMSWIEKESVLLKITVSPIISETDPDLEFSLDDYNIYVEVRDLETRALLLSKDKTSPSDPDIGVEFTEDGEHVIRIIILPSDYSAFDTDGQSERDCELLVNLQNANGENYSVFPCTQPSNKQIVRAIINLGRQEITVQ